MPVVADGRVVAVLVFFKDTLLPQEPQLIQLVEAIASQLGKTIETKETQQALRLGETGTPRRFGKNKGSFKCLLARGKPLPMAGTHKDISDRKQAELERERLLNSEPPKDCRLRTLLQSPQKLQDSYLKETQGGNLNSADTYCLVIDDIYEANFNNWKNLTLKLILSFLFSAVQNFGGCWLLMNITLLATGKLPK